MPHKKFAVHHGHLMLGNSSYSGVFVTPGTGKRRLGADVGLDAQVLAVTTETLDIFGRTHNQTAAWHQPVILLANIQTAVGIAVAEVAVAIDTSAVGGPPPWAMTSRAITIELLMSEQQSARLITGTRRQHQQGDCSACYSPNDQRPSDVHIPAKYKTPET
jgi:hypothetical protein